MKTSSSGEPDGVVLLNALLAAALNENEKLEQSQAPWPQDPFFYMRAIQSPKVQGLVKEALKSHDWSRACAYLRTVLPVAQMLIQTLQ
jgi:hypothetical protein